MEKLLTAIDNDDRATVQALLTGERSLATRLIGKAKLYRSKIFHWIYVSDTALHLAAAGYRLEIIHLLLASGADPNANSNHRRGTPLHYAADGFLDGPAWDAKRQVQTIQTLLNADAEINAQDKNGATPLHRAVRTRCADAVRCPLKSGADPCLQNKPGSTPFHLAVQNTGRGGRGATAAVQAQRQIIEELLAFGLSPEVKNSGGKTVRDSAQSDWIRELLAEASTKPGDAPKGNQ